MTYNPDIHHRRSIRLKGYDYSSAGAYFVTICVHGRECLFGRIIDYKMQLNNAGKMVENVWLELPGRFPDVVLDAFVVMPNHFHGILFIVGAPLAAPPAPPLAAAPPIVVPGIEYGNIGAANIAAANEGAASSAPTECENMGVPTLGIIMRAFKSISGIEVNRILERQGRPLWQRNYYERIIRNDDELSAIREYIMFNPAKWAEDNENPVS